MNVGAKIFGSPSGEPKHHNQTNAQKKCEKLLTLPVSRFLPMTTLGRSSIQTHLSPQVFLTNESGFGVYSDTQQGKLYKSFLISAQGGAPVEMYDEKNYQIDAHWMPDGKRIVYSRTPFLPGTSDSVDI